MERDAREFDSLIPDQYDAFVYLANAVRFNGVYDVVVAPHPVKVGGPGQYRIDTPNRE